MGGHFLGAMVWRSDDAVAGGRRAAYPAGADGRQRASRQRLTLACGRGSGGISGHIDGTTQRYRTGILTAPGTVRERRFTGVPHPSRDTFIPIWNCAAADLSQSARGPESISPRLLYALDEIVNNCPVLSLSRRC